jgi:hypothetical protein
MTDDTRTARSALYREKAAGCRRSAAEAGTPGARDDYLRMAMEWDKLADEVDAWSLTLGPGAP